MHVAVRPVPLPHPPLAGWPRMRQTRVRLDRPRRTPLRAAETRCTGARRPSPEKEKLAMDTLIGILTAVVGVFILAASLGAIVIVTTERKLPPLRRRRSRPQSR